MAGKNHIAIFSDRIAAAHATIASVCSTSASVSSLAFYLITANVTAAAALLALFDNHHGGGGGISGLASSCIGASIRVVSDRAAESAIRAARGGRAPSWMWTSYENELRRETTNANDGEPDKDARDFWVKPARWDHSVMHAHRLNHLRFYLPYLFPRDVRKVILLDDDVILLDDIRLVYDAAFPEEDDEDQDITPTFLDDDDDDDGQLKQNQQQQQQQQQQHQHSSSYLVSNCKLWKHDVAELHMWQWRTRLNMLQTTHTGLQEMYDPRAVWEVLCSAEERSRSHAPLRRRGCMRSSAFFDDLRTLALEQVPTSVGISQDTARPHSVFVLLFEKFGRSRFNCHPPADSSNVVTRPTRSTSLDASRLPL
ncbi:hexosyltransferase [Pycnococcus provasolii]